MDVEGDPPPMYEQQPVAERRGLRERMRHHQCREFLLTDEPRRGLHHPVGRGRIECGGVFIEQEQVGPVPCRHHERHDLPLAAGE